MRRALAAAFLAALVFAPGASAKDAPLIENRDVSGLEWLEMSAGRRLDHVVRSMKILADAGVTMGRTPNDYYNGVHERLRRDPSLYESTVTDILAGYVSARDPKAREVLTAPRKA